MKWEVFGVRRATKSTSLLTMLRLTWILEIFTWIIVKYGDKNRFFCDYSKMKHTTALRPWSVPHNVRGVVNIFFCFFCFICFFCFFKKSLSHKQKKQKIIFALIRQNWSYKRLTILWNHLIINLMSNCDKWQPKCRFLKQVM